MRRDMARQYGGILGLLAFSAVLFRCWLHGAGLATGAPAALAAMVCGAVCGLILGAIAEQTVTQSVRAKLDQLLKEQRSEDSTLRVRT
jgi:hypothetical protein